MKIIDPLTQWLENHACTPAYSGWLLAGISLCFFGAATNTMAGWLYVISGLIFALLVLGAIIPVRSLAKLTVRRLPISPVSAGEQLTVELEIHNPTPQPKTLLQVQDLLPYVISKPIQAAIEVIPPQSTHRWLYYPKAQRRGVYHWHEVQLRTGTPLGLFWCRRSREVHARAVVYPQVLPLMGCPLLDTLGQDQSLFQGDRRYQAATEGITRSLRPYRRGDSPRLIHWRTSARLGELKVRELDRITGVQEVVIALDNGPIWEEEAFEQAVVTAASLYSYASRCQLNVKLWTVGTGLLQGNLAVWESLAAVEAGEGATQTQLPPVSLVWLTQNYASINSLTTGSRWVFFEGVGSAEGKLGFNSNLSGLVINSEQSLQRQLQGQI